MFDNLGDRFQDIFKKMSGNSKITESNINEAIKEVKLALLESDVNYKVTKKIVNNIKEKAIGIDVIKGVNPKQQFIKFVNDELIEALGGTNIKLNYSTNTKPTIIMLVGLQGAGKTTFSAKLAKKLKKENKKALLVGADVYRPAAKKQLEVLAKQINIDFYTDFNENDVLKIVSNSLSFANEKKDDVIIIDTAGRLHIDENLMNELVEIKKLVIPDEILLVVDGMTGQDAVNLSKSFNEILDITGVVLTKLDGDTRGGAALSIKEVSSKPIKFISEGEKLDDISEFHPDRLVSRILGMGDIVSLVEKAKDAIDEKEAIEMEKKFRKNQFDFEDFLKQFKMIRKLGSLGGILKMLPGMKQLGDIDLNMAEKEFKKVESIIFSMTIKERRNPDLLKQSSRKIRIAKGSGVEVSSVNKLLKQYEQMKKMMKMFNNGAFSKFKLF